MDWHVWTDSFFNERCWFSCLIWSMLCPDQQCRDGLGHMCVRLNSLNKSLLGDMACCLTFITYDLIVSLSQEPIDITHEVHLDSWFCCVIKPLFWFFRFGMACKIVNVQSPMSGSFGCKWFAFEHMSIMIHCLELWVVSHVGWNLGVPVMSWSCQSMWSLIQFPACALLGQSCGSFATIISSSRRVPLQKAFLQVPCFSFWPSSTAMDANSLAADQLKTGTQWSSQDYTLCSKFPRSTTLDFALIGFPFWFGFIANRFIVGIEQALFPCFFGWFLHFSVLISVKTFNPSDPSYSLLHAASHALWSILVRADVMRKLGGAKLWHDIAAEIDPAVPQNKCASSNIHPMSKVFSSLHIFQEHCMFLMSVVLIVCPLLSHVANSQRSSLEINECLCWWSAVFGSRIVTFWSCFGQIGFEKSRHSEKTCSNFASMISSESWSLIAWNVEWMVGGITANPERMSWVSWHWVCMTSPTPNSVGPFILWDLNSATNPHHNQQQGRPCQVAFWCPRHNLPRHKSCQSQGHRRSHYH